MANVSDDMRRRIAETALMLFARHGFARTSMADIAREAQVARATVHLAFRDKTVLFEHLAAQVADDALLAAEAAWPAAAQGSLAARLAEVLLAKDLPLFRLLHASPHGAALLSQDAELTRHHAERLDAGFEALLATRLASWPGLDFAVFGAPADAASFIRTAGAGLKHEARDEATFVRTARQLAEATARALHR